MALKILAMATLFNSVSLCIIMTRGCARRFICNPFYTGKAFKSWLKLEK